MSYIPRLESLVTAADIFQVITTERRKSKSGRLASASGYDPTWLNLNKAKHGISKDIDTTVIGGFTDEYIFDERPIANPQAGSDNLMSQSSNQVRLIQKLQNDIT